jgi:hypothetical protein
MDTTQSTEVTDLKDLKGSNIILILGISSIAISWAWGIAGLACGLLSLKLAKLRVKEYSQNSAAYKPNAYTYVKAGKICAQIGTIISVLVVFFLIIKLLIVSFYQL